MIVDEYAKVCQLFGLLAERRGTTLRQVCERTGWDRASTFARLRRLERGNIVFRRRGKKHPINHMHHKGLPPSRFYLRSPQRRGLAGKLTSRGDIATIRTG